MSRRPLLPLQPWGPAILFFGVRMKSLLLSSSSGALSYCFGKVRGEENALPFPSLSCFVQDHSCSGTAEATQAAGRGHKCPSVPPGQLCQHLPCCCCPGGTAGRHPLRALPACPPDFEPPSRAQAILQRPIELTDRCPIHNLLRNATFENNFRSPQRAVKKLASAYMNVTKLSLNQIQKLKIFLQAKPLLFSKSLSKDKK